MPSKRQRAKLHKQQKQQQRERRQIAERCSAKSEKRYKLDYRRVEQVRESHLPRVLALVSDKKKHHILKEHYITAETILEFAGCTIQIWRFARELRLNTDDVVLWFRKCAGINPATNELQYHMTWTGFCDHFKIQCIEVAGALLNMTHLVDMLKEKQKTQQQQ